MSVDPPKTCQDFPYPACFIDRIHSPVNSDDYDNVRRARLSAANSERPRPKCRGHLLMNERRKVPRFRTLKGGSITFDRVAGLPCIIRNLTNLGACIDVEGHTTVPNNFSLIIQPEIICRDCAVIWRNGQRVGVEFH
ncbi:MAG: hypothetical protein JO254_05150 [Pseudolabrys sp.]|nr:hypothetical protein [Pseudolabrys sp.]